MVQILRCGERKTKSKTFYCESCGCVFRTDIYSRDFGNLEDVVPKYISNCPQCLSHATEKISK